MYLPAESILPASENRFTVLILESSILWARPVGITVRFAAMDHSSSSGLILEDGRVNELEKLPQL